MYFEQLKKFIVFFVVNESGFGVRICTFSALDVLVLLNFTLSSSINLAKLC